MDLVSPVSCGILWHGPASGQEIKPILGLNAFFYNECQLLKDAHFCKFFGWKAEDFYKVLELMETVNLKILRYL